MQHIWGRVDIHIWVWWRILRERVQLENQVVDGKIINKNLQDMKWKDMEWNNMAQERKRKRILLNAVMNHCVYTIRGIS